VLDASHAVLVRPQLCCTAHSRSQSDGLTKSPASTWPNRAKNRSSTRFAVNSARSLISAALAQSPNTASSTLCYLLWAFRHRGRESAQTLQTGGPARHAARRVLVSRARLCVLSLRLRPPGAGTGSNGDALSHPKPARASARACPYRHLEVITEWPNIMPAPHATREPSDQSQADEGRRPATACARRNAREASPRHASSCPSTACAPLPRAGFAAVRT
jgi:hypothetical protein